MFRQRTVWMYLALIGSLLLVLLVGVLSPLGSRATEEDTPVPPGATISPTPALASSPESGTFCIQAGNALVYLPLILRPSSSSAPSEAPPPIVVQQSVVRGEEIAPDRPIALTFDRPMDAASVESAFELVQLPETPQSDAATEDEAAALTSEPVAIEGRFEWNEYRTTLSFAPAQVLPRGASYQVVVGEHARSADGVSLKGPYQFRFATHGYLKVGQVIPADDTPDVAPDSSVTVMFNRPVVPLTMVEQQDALPHPLTFSPAVEGTGTWLNTSVYVFQPSEPLEPGTTYTVAVADDLQDAVGNPMQEPSSWSFTTALPPEVEVVSVSPHGGSDLVPIETTIAVQFDQPVEPASARSAFQLRSSEEGSSVAGDFQVREAGTTLVFTPAQRLAFDHRYTVEVAVGVESASGGRPLVSSYRGTFTTVPLPRITGTDPADGDTQAPYSTDLTIFFNTPIDPDTVMPNLQMTPPFSPTQVYTYFSRYDQSFHLHFDVRPSTSYTVHIAPDITDPYGNPTGQTLDVHFRTQPRPPSARLITPGEVGTSSAYNPTRVGVRSVNMAQVSLRLYQMEPDSLFDRFYGDQIPNNAVLLRDWQEPITAFPYGENQGMPTVSRVDLAEDGGALEAGVYLLLLERPDSPSYPDRHLLVVSPINLTLKAGEHDALVWANDLQSGQPVPDLTVDFYDRSSRNLLGTATTDAEGVARVEMDRPENRGVIALARQPFSAADTDWSRGVSPWDFDLPATSDLPEMAAHIYTDRPIYRPDQTVSFKGVLRNEDDARFNLPAGVGPVEVVIMNAAREEVYRETLSLTDYGTFQGELVLPESAALGSYSIRVNVGQGSGGSRSFWSEFDVAAYRAPEFQVEVTPQADEIVRGPPLRAIVEVAYFFGMPVENAPVEWTVRAVDYRFTPAQYGRYQFGSTDDPWHCWECWWMPGVTPETILSGSGTTDGQGHLHIDLPANLKDRQGDPISDSVRLTIEATVTGRDNQVVSNRSDVVVHSGAVYVGLASQNYFGKAGEVQAIDVIALDTEEQPQTGQSVEVEVFRLTWDNTYHEDTFQWEWEEQETLVHQQTVTTDQNGQAVVSFTPPEGGSYRVVARTQDGEGHRVRSSLFLWVAGEGYVSWRHDNNDRISLIADKVSYTVGETAEILIPSPFQSSHWALITVERGGILSHEVRQMEGNSTLYRLPLTAEHPPNVFVSVVLFNPPSVYGSGPSVPADYKVGILPLEVEPDPQTLRVSITPDVEQAEPGEEVRFTVEVTDLEGQPVAVELSLDLVDKAVLSLMPRVPNAILKAFYDKRPLGIFTASGLAISADRLIQLDEEEAEEDEGQKGEGDTFDGDEEQSSPLAPTPAPSPTEPGRGEESGGAGSAPTVREEFADTAYWEGTIMTGDDGRATVSVQLPDNLTTWVMRGVGLTFETEVGEGTAELIATRPLLIRPVTPRFLVVDDVVELAANVSNRTDAPLEVQVGLSTRGLTVTDALTRTVQIGAGSEEKVTWEATVQDVTSVDLVFQALSGPYYDASRPTLATGPGGTIPVYRYSAPETVGTAGQLEGEAARTEVIALPSRMDEQRGELTVRLDPSLAASMRDSLTYLEHYPYECTEQTVSRFLPNVLTARALERLGVSNPDLEARLPALVREGLNRLYQRQHHDGGWGWWDQVQEYSNPHISAYVVFGLLRTQEAGYQVRDDVLERGLDYLEQEAQAMGSLTNPHRANLQAWLISVLAEGGRYVPDRLDDLYDHRDHAGVYGRAFLALALHATDASDRRVQTLLSELQNDAILSATGAHWEEPARDHWSMTTDTRSTAIALSALVRLDPDHALNPNVVRWLMVARQGDRWETTQETAWAIMALTDWMVHTGELDADYDYAVWLNEPGSAASGDPQFAGHIGQDDVDEPVVLRAAVADLLSDATTWLTVGRGSGGGRLYYTAHLQAFLPVEDIQALDRGIIVRRRYTLASCTEGPECPEVSEASVGDVIRVEVSVTAPNDLYYVVVEDPLPAGAEIIDSSLATSAQDGNGPGTGQSLGRSLHPWYWWWWRWYSRSEFRDEKAVLFADRLPEGSYVYTYEIRATVPGTFHVIPTTANEFYFPEVSGRGEGQVMEIAP